MGADHSITTQTILGIQRSDGKILSTDNYWTIYPKGDDGLFGFENAIDILDFAATAGANTYTVLVEDISQNTAPIAFDDTVEIPEGALVILEDIGNEERGRSYLARDGVYIQSSIFDDNGNGADIDPDGDALTLVSIDGQSVFPYFLTETAQGSRVAFNPEGEFMFLGVPGTTETFTYVVRDGRGATDEATVTFITPAGNEGPIAGDDAFDVVNTGGNIFTVFINDSDPDGDPLSISSFNTAGTIGQVQLLNASQGQFFYAPQDGFNGADSFTYTVTDGQDEATATVTLNVDVEPEPDLGLFFTDEDQHFFFSEFDILEDGEAFFGSVEFEIDPIVGTIEFDEEGYVFTPAKNVNGTFDVPYTAFNEEFGEVSGEITIVIEPIDDAPIAAADRFVTAFETSRVIVVDDLTRNDSDGDPELDQPLEITGVQGDNVIFDGAAVTFMPAAGFVGDATFTYTLSDPSKQTSTAVVTVSVDAPDVLPEPPLAVDDVYTIPEDNTLAVDASLGVLANDSDPNDDALTVSLFAGASKGIVDLRTDGSFIYTPFQDANGEDRFTYEVSDGTDTDLAVAVLNIAPLNDAPVVLNPLRDQVIDEDESFRFEVPQNTFFDVDGDNLELTAALSDRSALPDWIVFTREDNSFSGQPPQDVNGTVEIAVTASDGQRDAQSTFLLIVSPVNDAPVVAVPAADQQSDEDEDFKFQLAPNTFSDVDGDQLSYTATLADGSALPSWITFDAEAQEFRGRPPQDSTAHSTLKSRHSMGSTALTRLSRLW